MPCPRLSALPRGGGLFGLCLVISLAAAWGVGSPRAQVGGTDSLAAGDTAGLAESLRVADSVAVADSIAFEQEAAEDAATFGSQRSILDQSRPGGYLNYNTSYAVNRGNRTWTQNANLYLAPGPVQVANTTNITIGREDRIGRLNRNRSTRTEVAYRVTPWMRLGGALGLQRQSDDARNANFTGIRQANNDVSAQARFNKRFGPYPVRALASYGFLDNTQALQSSSGATIGLSGATSRDFGNGNTINLDFAQQLSKLSSTVADSVGYEQTDRNTSRDIRVSGQSRITRWINADMRLATQRSRVERPARIPSDPNDPLSDEVIVAEAIDGLNDNLDAGLHLRLPLATALNFSGGVGRTRQVYDAETSRTSISSIQQFRADVTKPFLGMNPSVSYDNSVSENDQTNQNPGWISSSLSRKLDVSAGRPLSRNVTTRFNGTVTLSRRRYLDFRTTRPGAVPPSGQDNRRIRGSLNLSYKVGSSFDTGVTAGIEENDVVNIARSSSLNNARLRTYSVAWNWTARPGSAWSVTQNNSATAAQQYFNFTPDRDQLSFIYSLATSINTTLTRSVRLDLTSSLRLQSRGTWRLVDTQRLYGKSSEFNSLDLGLRTAYTPTSWLTLEALQRLSVSPNYTLVAQRPVKTNESRRTEFTGSARVVYPFGSGASLSADVRRTLATDRALTFGTTFGDRATNNDYWLANVSLRKSFGGP